MGTRKPVVAITHYLTQKGGAERVVLATHRAFPEAKIYMTLYHPDGTYPEFSNAEIVTSHLNKIPYFRKNHRAALPFLAPVSTSLKNPADIVLSSSNGWAHGFSTAGSTFVYCHSPARWLYLTEQYIGKAKRISPAAIVVKILRPALRRWNRRAAARADVYVANSTVVQERINDVYGMYVDIMHPAHSVDTDGRQEPIPGLEAFVGEGGHFLVVSRLLSYKNVDQAVEAFREIGERLLVIGAGPMLEELRAAASPNVRFASNLSDAQMRWAYASAASVIAPSHEDFGITPLEGAAWGKPTSALRAGGYLDTIVDGTTGVFIYEPSAACIQRAVLSFNADSGDSSNIKNHVETFSETHFRKKLQAGVDALLREKTTA